MTDDPTPLLKQFDFTRSLTEQILTLTTASVGLTLVLWKDIAKLKFSIWLRIAWLLFFVSIVAGILTLGSLTGSLSTDPLRIISGTRVWAFIQWLSFPLGIGATFMFMCKALPRKGTGES